MSEARSLLPSITRPCPACMTEPMRGDESRILRLPATVTSKSGARFASEITVPCPLCKPAEWYVAGDDMRELWHDLLIHYGKEP